MNANGAVRGSRVGADPLTAESWQVDNGRDTDALIGTVIRYVCPGGHSTTVRFAPLEDTEVPPSWDCSTCHQMAGREGALVSVDADEPYKTPLEYAKERRNAEDAEQILADALKRSRREN